MRCADCEELLAGCVEEGDGALAGEAREEVDRHLASCGRCRALPSDLRRIREAAAQLDRLTPPPHVWSRVAQQLAPRPGAARTMPAWGWLAAAAALVLALGAAFVATRAARAPAPTQAARAPAPVLSPASATTGDGNLAATALVETIENELRLAEKHYERAIQGLERIANAQHQSLDPQVAATMQKNIAVIDQAITESRAALRGQPESQPAQDSLFEALRRKVVLLQDTIALMNEMRKGDEAGAARIVQGLEKS